MEYLMAIVMFGITTVVSIIGFFIKRLFTKVDSTEVALRNHIDSDNSKYSTKEDCRNDVQDFKEFVKEVVSPMNRKLESIEVCLRSNDRRKGGDSMPPTYKSI